MKFAIEIQDRNGSLRRIRLDHEYNSEEEALSEAEGIADIEYKETDIAWNIIEEL